MARLCSAGCSPARRRLARAAAVARLERHRDTSCRRSWAIAPGVPRRLRRWTGRHRRTRPTASGGFRLRRRRRRLSPQRRAAPGLLDKAPVVIDVIAPPSRGRKIDGIRFTACGRLGARRPARWTGFPARARHGPWSISPARSATGRCAAASSGRRSGDCSTSRRSRPRWIPDAAGSTRGPRRRAPRRTGREQGRLKSPLEAKVLPLVTRRGLPAPLLNAPVEIANGRIEVDFLSPTTTSSSRPTPRSPRLRGRIRARPLARPRTLSCRLRHPPRHPPQPEHESAAVAETIAARLA